MKRAWLAIALGSALSTAASAPAQIATGHHLVLTGTPAGGAALLDVDTATGAVRPLRRFTLDAFPPLACCWDPIGRHAIVAVATPLGSVLLRVDPAGPFERFLALVPEPIVALELGERGDLHALTGGPNGAIWELARNGGAPRLRLAMPHATALGAPKLSPIVWIAQSPPAAPPTITFVDPRLGTVLVPPIPLPALVGRRVTGVYDLPTGAIREVLTDDAGQVHLLEFGAHFRTIPVTPPLPAGAAVDLLFEQGAATLDALLLGDARHPYVHRVPIFGGPPVAARLAGPLPGDPIDFDIVDSRAGWSFGHDCGGSFGAQSLVVRPGAIGFYEARRAPAGAPALAVFGLSDQGWAGIPLPVALPGGGCPLLVSLDVLVPTRVDPSGLARVAFPVPATLPRGFGMYAQWIFPGAAGLATSAAASHQVEP